MSIEKKVYDLAVEALRICERPQGFFASGLPGGYDALWSRDSMITCLGASLVGDEFKKTFRRSLETLADNQTENGLIPNCVGSYNIERRSDVTFNSIDAPQWFVIGHYVYAKAYRDVSLLKKHRGRIQKAIGWLKYQDPNEDKLIVQQPTMDWMDAFPHKYGRVLHTQALQYALLKMTGQNDLALYIRDIINGKTQKYLSLWDNKLGYFRPWIWKDHDGDRESEEWFDSLANVLAIVAGLADKKHSAKILSHIKKSKIDKPHPLKAIWPPIKPGDKAWKSYFDKCDARTPYEYLNGGIWPMIGGFYVAAFVKTGKMKEAKAALTSFAKANAKLMEVRNLENKYGFNEWHHGRSGKPSGEPIQGWTAGMYIYAYECVKQKKVLYF